MLRPLVAERTLFLCVLASIVLHALVLLGLSGVGVVVPPVKTLLVLTARLSPFAPAPRIPVQPRTPKAAPSPLPKPPLAPRRDLAKPAAIPKPAPQQAAPAESLKPPQPEPAQAAANTSLSPALVTTPAQSAPVPQAAAGVPAANTSDNSGDAAEAGTVEQYRLALIIAARRYKRYPAIALEKGWQGRVDVHMVIGANGVIASASIKTGSGHDILDNQALDMLKKGKTTVPIPASLRGREFSIDVPVIFNLDNPAS
jgi:protein TonB